MKKECSRSLNRNNDEIGKIALLSPHISHSEFLSQTRDFCLQRRICRIFFFFEIPYFSQVVFN